MTTLTPTRLDALLRRFAGLHILVLGDFFLDKYLVIDRTLAEVSLETGLEAHQVVRIGCSPGAAGTVAANLRALGVQVTALGILGADGQGFELRRELVALGVDVEAMVETGELFTPTYTKPRLRERDGREHELERLDIKNRHPLPEVIQSTLVERLRRLTSQVDGVIVADQVGEVDCGVITRRVGAEIDALASRSSSQIIAVDSRTRIAERRNVILKPNAREAVAASQAVVPDAITQGLAREAGLALQRRSGRPVYLTLGSEGILLCSEGVADLYPAVPVTSEIDIVGAGDSCLAGIVSSLCSGATPAEAAIVGNLVASITIQQIGATGTASPDQVRARLALSPNRG